MRAALPSIVLVFGLALASCDSGPKSGRGFRLPDGDAEAGKVAFVELRCHDCHRVYGVDLPPSETPGQFSLTLGGQVHKVETYGELPTAIVNPSHKLTKPFPKEKAVPGGKSPMPNFNGVMTVSQMINLVTFLQPHYELMIPSDEFYLYH